MADGRSLIIRTIQRKGREGTRGTSTGRGRGGGDILRAVGGEMSLGINKIRKLIPFPGWGGGAKLVEE